MNALKPTILLLHARLHKFLKPLYVTLTGSTYIFFKKPTPSVTDGPVPCTVLVQAQALKR